MLDSINSPLFLSLFFSALCASGGVALLRWASNGEKKDIVASAGIGVTCLIAVICAFGRVGEPFQFGMNALAIGLIVIIPASLFCRLWVAHLGVRVGIYVFLALLWIWMIAGMPLGIEDMVKALLAISVLAVLTFVIWIRIQVQFAKEKSAMGGLQSLLIVSLCLALFSFSLGDQIGGNFALGIGVACLGGLIWTYPRIGLDLADNALFVLSLCVSVLAWDMWLQGYLPLFSVACLVMVLFSGDVSARLVAGKSNWLQKSAGVLQILISLLPIGLSLVFFDILRSL